MKWEFSLELIDKHQLFLICNFSNYSRVAVVSKSFEDKADQIEKWYGTKYSVEQIPNELLEVSFIDSPVLTILVFKLARLIGLHLAGSASPPWASPRLS